MFTVGEATNREFPAAGGQRPGRVKLGSSEGSGGPEGVETPQTFHMSLRTPSGSLVGARTRRTEVARFKTARAEIPGEGKGLKKQASPSGDAAVSEKRSGLADFADFCLFTKS